VTAVLLALAASLAGTTTSAFGGSESATGR
jgi:hypothetical protein